MLKRNSLSFVSATTGLALGTALVIYELFNRPALPWSDEAAAQEAVAWINGQPLREQYYRQAIKAVDNDKRMPLTTEDTQRILDRLIDEELLIQQALDLGYLHHDVKVRALLIGRMRDRVLATDSEEADNDRLQAFFAEHRDRFTSPTVYHVRQIAVAGEDHRQQAEKLKQSMHNGTPFEPLWRQYRTASIDPVPDSPLPSSKLYQLLGERAFQALQSMQPGEVSEPIHLQDQSLLLQLVDTGNHQPVAFEQVRDQVAALYQRFRDEQAFGDYVQQLRQQADIQLALPAAP